jgi:hypothetical protein
MQNLHYIEDKQLWSATICHRKTDLYTVMHAERFSIGLGQNRRWPGVMFENNMQQYKLISISFFKICDGAPEQFSGNKS